MNLILAQKKYHSNAERMQAIVDAADGTLTDEQQAEFNNLKTENINIRKEQPAAVLDCHPGQLKLVHEPWDQVTPLGATAPAQPAAVQTPGNRMRCLTGSHNDIRHKAQVAANYFRAIGGDVSAALWLRENGVGFSSAHSEGSNTGGGYTVPTILSADVINLMNSYGVFRKNSRVRTMTSDKLDIPRRTSGFSPYFVGEGSEGTTSDKGWDLVSLVAKKLMVLTSMSNELFHDSQLNLIDDFFSEFAYALAEKEDACGFNGDGTSTYGGIVGVIQKLSTLNGVDDGGGLILGAGNTFSEITLANMTSMISRCPSYARRNAKWHCSPVFYGEVMLRLMVGGGGNAVRDYEDGARMEKFLAYPVEVNESMPTTDANSQIACLFGDLAQATSFGDRQQITFATAQSGSVDGSTDLFASDSVGLRAVERFDINVHDVGTASAAGPIVGLITAAA